MTKLEIIKRSNEQFNCLYLICRESKLGFGLSGLLQNSPSWTMAKKESQVDHYEHSAVKVRLLKEYLQAYLSAISHSPYFDAIHVYDLFCGEGIYPNGGKGSPIIILDTIEEIKGGSTNTNLHATRFHFTINDIDENSLCKVKAYLESNSEKTEWLSSIAVHNRNYRDFIPELSNKFRSLRREKAFVFIDPYGYSDIYVSDIKDLLAGNNSEVLLFLPTQFMYRFDNDAAPDSLIRFVGELDPNAEWTSSNTGLEYIDKVKNGFRKSLNGDYFVDTFVIAKAKNEFFCLFFFTAHIFGFEKMLEAKWSIDNEEGRGWRPENYVKNSGQIDLFAETKEEPVTYNLEKKLSNFLSEWRTNKELYHFILEAGFLPRHATPLIKDWAARNKVEVENLEQPGLPVKKYFIDYTNYKPAVAAKVRIKLK